MNLSDATGLLGNQARYFSDVYKLFDFKDNQNLKDYLDFIVHEPVEWMKGFPARLTQKGSFSRPKAAIIKLLKHTNVIQVLGKEYTQNVYDTVWNTFKKHVEVILTARQAQCQGLEDDADSEQSAEPVPPNLLIMEDAESVRSNHSVRPPKRVMPATPDNWETKYRVLEKAYIALLTEGAQASALTLLSALSSV